MAMAFLPIPLLCLLVLSPLCVFAQTRSDIIVGENDSLSAGDSNSSWVVSPSGDFAFGFRPLEGNNLFLLSVWYAKIPDKTIVWYANGDNPAPKGSKVQLSSDTGLLLTSPNGTELWKPDSVSGTVSRGVLNDSGNFALKDSNFNSLWETFSYPKDTMLPSQILAKGQKLSSRFSEANFSLGRFRLLLQDDGNLVFHSVNLPSEYINENYYESGTVESNTSRAGLQLEFDKSGTMYILRDGGDKFNLSTKKITSASQSYLRATLNFDGVFTLYQYPKSSSGNGSWNPLWSLPDNICTATLDSQSSGVCGYNSYCDVDSYSRPICKCPTGYSLLDPNDKQGSCVPNFIQGCEEDKLSQGTDLYDFEVLTNTDWPLSDYVLQKPFTEEQCKQSCMEDCMCAVAIFRLGDSCWKKKLPLSNGKVDSTLNGAHAYIKVRKDNSSLLGPPPLIVKKNQNTWILVASVLLGGSVFLNLVLIGALCLSFSFIYQYKKKLKRVNKSDRNVESNLRCFSFEELEEATNGFKEELGRGAFGVVYLGALNINSATASPVAVKKLNTSFLLDIEKEFMNEVNVIGQTHHKNLVRLLGFCEQGTERLLVYEYMSNGTLASFLFNDIKPSWNLRLQIAFGIARGLLYLHEECSSQIIHCDIKPQNILLDDYCNARISDFGLAKLLNMNQSRTNTAIRGTKGYVALEWFKNMPITAKVDVYSFGVLLLEIICCRKNVDMELDNEEEAILSDWAYDCYTEGTLDVLVEHDQEALDDRKNLEKLVMVALWCVQEDPNLRPTMRKVTQMLEGVVEVPALLCSAQSVFSQDQH